EGIAERRPRHPDQRRLRRRHVALQRGLFDEAARGLFSLQNGGHATRMGGFGAPKPTYLHSCATRSSACESPLSLYRSVDLVPRPDSPVITRSEPRRIVSTMRASSAAFLIHAPSACVYITYFAEPISTFASEPGLIGYPITIQISLR